MKRTLFIIILFASAMTLQAQFLAGLKAGYNSTTLSAKPDTVDTHGGSGFHAGMWARVGKKFYFQPEVYYSLQNSRFEGTETPWEQQVTTGTVDIPLLAGFSMFGEKTVRLRIEAGPVVSFVVNRDVKDKTAVAGPLSQSDLSDINWALQAGAGLDVGSFSFGIRYQSGLNNVIRDVLTAEWDSKSSGWFISVGYKLF